MRPELIHPLIVHFPIALLFIGAVVRLVVFFLRKMKGAQFLLGFSWLLLLLGVCFAWMAIAAGEIAEEIVKGNLCEPDILEYHQQLAYSAATLFTVALLLDLGKLWKRMVFSRKWIVCLMSLFYFAATIILLVTGSFGAKLVYEQGAAVEKSCSHP